MLNGHGRVTELVKVHLSKTFVSLHFLYARPAYLGIELFKLVVVINIIVLFVFLDPVKGRLGDIYFTLLYEFRHISIEERQKQRPYMRSVHVGIGHDNDLVIPELCYVKILGNSRSKGCYHIFDFLGIKYPVKPCLFHVEYFAPQRKHGLRSGIPCLDGRAAGGITLDNIYLTFRRILARAVRQLSGELCVFQTRLSSDELPGLSGGLPRP